MRRPFLLASLLFIASCGDDESGPSPPANLSGELAYIPDSAIAIHNFADGTTRRIELKSVGAVQGLAWQPDGRALVYAPLRSGFAWYELHQVPLDGSSTTVLYPSVGHQNSPSFAPDGRIAYWVNGPEHSYTIFIDGQPALVADATCPLSRVAWSPDGAAIVVVVRVDGADRLVRVNVATGSADELFLAAGDQNAEQLFDPVYSHAGNQLVFTRVTFGAPQSGRGELWAINADGSNPRRLTSDNNDSWATWSPDDAWVAFQRESFIAIVPAAGGSATRLIEGTGAVPAWR